MSKQRYNPKYEQQASLFHNEGSSFQLDIDFVVQMHVPAQGHMTLKWDGKDRWWRKIVMEGFEQVEVRNGDTLYTSRNVGFTPLHSKELISLVEFAESSEPFAVKKQKQHVENGVEVTYLQVSRKDINVKPHEVCLNAASNEILSDEWSDVPESWKLVQSYDRKFTTTSISETTGSAPHIAGLNFHPLSVCKVACPHPGSTYRSVGCRPQNRRPSQ